MDTQKLNWIKFLIGRIKEEELTPENKERLEEQRRQRKQPGGELKPFDGGIVNAYGEDN